MFLDVIYHEESEYHIGFVVSSHLHHVSCKFVREKCMFYMVARVFVCMQPCPFHPVFFPTMFSNAIHHGDSEYVIGFIVASFLHIVSSMFVRENCEFFMFSQVFTHVRVFLSMFTRCNFIVKIYFRCNSLRGIRISHWFYCSMSLRKVIVKFVREKCMCYMFFTWFHPCFIG